MRSAKPASLALAVITLICLYPISCKGGRGFGRSRLSFSRATRVVQPSLKLPKFVDSSSIFRKSLLPSYKSTEFSWPSFIRPATYPKHATHSRESISESRAIQRDRHMANSRDIHSKHESSLKPSVAERQIESKKKRFDADDILDTAGEIGGLLFDGDNDDQHDGELGDDVYDDDKDPYSGNDDDHDDVYDDDFRNNDDDINPDSGDDDSDLEKDDDIYFDDEGDGDDVFDNDYSRNRGVFIVASRNLYISLYISMVYLVSF